MVAYFLTVSPNDAYAQAAGSSDEVYISGASLSAANVSLTGADGDLWFAMEWIDPGGTPTNPGLTLIWYDLSGMAMAAKTLQSAGALTDNGIYPSLMTGPSFANVFVVGKVDPTGTGTQPHLRVHTQDRDTFGTASTSERVTAEGDLEHSVPHLARDSALPEQHLCWTAKDASTEDVRTKALDGADWLASTFRTVANSATDVEDHCEMDFTYSGRRYAVYHRDQSGGRS